MRYSLPRLLHIAAALAVALAGGARADVLLDNTNLAAAAGAPAPSQFSFTASSAQALTLTLTDFQAPVAFASLKVAVTLGDTLVGMATADANTHTATLAIPAAAGNYTLYVIGTPGAAAGNTTSAGSFGVCVAPATAASSCIAADSFSGTIQTPATASTTPSSPLETEFVSTVAGVYTVTITDDQFPVPLQSVTGGVTNGSAAVNTTGFTLGANQITLAAGTTYTLILGALADATVQAGLYGVHIADPTGAAVFDRTLPVGTLPSSTVVDNPSSQALNLTLSDLMYPAPLTQVGVAVTSGSTALAALTAPGSKLNFMAPAGSIEIWRYAVEGAQPGVYNVNLSNLANTSSLFTTTQVVNPSATSGQSFAFVGTVPTAGTYTLTATDFQFPAALQSLSATVAQNGALLTQSGSGSFSAAAGPIVVLVNAAAAAGGSGIFDVSVASTAATPQSVLDQTQSVGGVFTTQSIVLGTSGNFDTTLTDLGFPANFSDLAVVVSQGSTVLGKAYGGGTFTFGATPGTYVVTIVDTPSSTANYGLYSIDIASSAPTITFTASAATVTAGGTVTLNWSTQSATACTASGATGWTGSQMTSGTLALAVSASETLTLSCTGPGGSASQSVSVTATPAPSKSGGGGVDLGLLAGLGALLAMRRRR